MENVLHLVSYSLDFLKVGCIGDYIGAIKGDIRGLDYGSCGVHGSECNARSPGLQFQLCTWEVRDFLIPTAAIITVL